jgi:hypothetical protein
MTRRVDNLRVRIDSLVLDGFPSEGTQSLVHALRDKLAGLLAADGPGCQVESTAQIDAGDLQIDRGDPPRMIGTRIASAMYRGMAPGDKR